MEVLKDQGMNGLCDGAFTQPGQPQLVSMAEAGLPRRPMLITTVASRALAFTAIFIAVPPLDSNAGPGLVPHSQSEGCG